MTSAKTDNLTFNNLGIEEQLLAILHWQKFTVPTPIQHQCIPAALSGQDIIGIAQTGTGKTLAFGVPMIQQLAKNRGQGLVLLPTRELAIQVEEVLRQIGDRLRLRTAVIIGGAPMNRQARALRANPDIVVATPGRLNDHIQQGVYNPNRVKIVVLDEADRMLDIGFAPQIKQILSHCTSNRQTLLFSATIPGQIAALASQYMKTPIRIEVAPSGTPAVNVEQELYVVSKDQKMQLLEKILFETEGSVLVFSRTKRGAKKITAEICAMGINAVEIHSNRSMAQRKMAMEGFKNRRYRVLVATDIAARGIDVTDITLVVNYDLPDASEDYVHRIGRTGRAGSMGKAISFVAPEQRGLVRDIEKLIRKYLPVIMLPILPPRRATPKYVADSNRWQENRPRNNFRKGGFRKRY